jgi:predicted ATPase
MGQKLVSLNSKKIFMSKIRIKNFGPIKDGFIENDGWMDIKKATVFIGNQGSGKSTVAKVFSTLTWLEKAINRGDVDRTLLSHSVFYGFFEYQRIKSYFRNNTIIEYEGDALKITYSKNLKCPDVQVTGYNTFNVPKIMYVPAERNFLSAVKNAYGIKNLPDTLYTFAEELRKGQFELNGKLLPLPISEFEYKYNKEKDTSYIVGKNFESDMLESSSGFQSFVPLYLVTKFLVDELQKGENVLRDQLNVEQSVRRNKEIAEVMFDNTLSDQDKERRVKEIDSRYLNTCFINIVEEPEQNLFPTSQQKILNSLLSFNNMNINNKLVITTHSPYLINFLSIAIQGAYLLNKIGGDFNTAIDNLAKNNIDSKSLKDRLDKIVPLNTLISADNVAVFELDEENGIITKLPTYEGIPSDKNFLNKSLADGNHLFDALLEIEEEL